MPSSGGPSVISAVMGGHADLGRHRRDPVLITCRAGRSAVWRRPRRFVLPSFPISPRAARTGMGRVHRDVRGPRCSKGPPDEVLQRLEAALDDLKADKAFSGFRRRKAAYAAVEFRHGARRPVHGRKKPSKRYAATGSPLTTTSKRGRSGRGARARKRFPHAVEAVPLGERMPVRCKPAPGSACSGTRLPPGVRPIFTGVSPHPNCGGMHVGYGVVAAASAYLLIWIIPAYTPEYPGYAASPASAPRHCCRVHAGAVPAQAGAGGPSAAEKNRQRPANAVRWRHLACSGSRALLMPVMF